MPLKGGEFDLRFDPLTSSIASFHHFLNLVFSFKKFKSPPNPLSGTGVRRGFDNLTCPNGGIFDHLFGQIPTIPHPLPQGGIVGPTIDRCITRTCIKYLCTHAAISELINAIDKPMFGLLYAGYLSERLQNTALFFINTAFFFITIVCTFIT